MISNISQALKGVEDTVPLLHSFTVPFIHFSQTYEKFLSVKKCSYSSTFFFRCSCSFKAQCKRCCLGKRISQSPSWYYSLFLLYQHFSGSIQYTINIESSYYLLQYYSQVLLQFQGILAKNFLSKCLMLTNNFLIGKNFLSSQHGKQQYKVSIKSQMFLRKGSFQNRTDLFWSGIYEYYQRRGEFIRYLSSQS